MSQNTADLEYAPYFLVKFLLKTRTLWVCFVFEEMLVFCYQNCSDLKSVSLKIEPSQYIAMYCDGPIFNEAGVSTAYY